MEGLFGGVEEKQLSRLQAGQFEAEGAAYGTACSGDEDRGVSEWCKRCGRWRWQPGPRKEAVPVDAGFFGS
jgi:hypothetical protein